MSVAPTLPADRLLPDSESWFRTLAETTSTAILVYREEFLYVNRACEELSGYRAEELIGRPVSLLVHPDFQEVALERARARLRGEAVPPHYELKIVRKDGEERWVDLNSGLVEVGGEPAALGTALDVTERKLSEIALRESGARLELAQRVARMATWEWNLLTDELVFFGEPSQLLGCGPDQVWKSGPELLAAVHPEDQARFAKTLARCIRQGGDFTVEFRLIVPDGSVRWFSERGRGLADETGAVTRLIGVASDVTPRKLAEDALHQEQERAQVTLASIGDGVIRTDAAGRIDYLNPVAERLTGWPAGEAVGQPVLRVFNVVDETGRKPLFDPVERCLREDRVIELPGYSLLCRRDGVEFAVRDSVAPIRDREGRITGSVLVFKDVTELRGMEREMSYLARHDPLTGLINRREFEIRLEHCLGTAREDGRRHALCYLDLDEFKVVNDTSGHLAGDELLKQLTALLQSRMRRADTLARLGGDEFGVLLDDTDLGRAREIGEALRAAVKQFRFVWQERIFELGVSIGLVPIHADSGDMARVLSAADAACYVAKESGRNRIHEYQPDDTTLAERYDEMQWIHRIHKAFEEQRFRLYRQPILPLASGFVQGSPPEGPEFFEIFIRMVDEEGQMASPGAFIPAAERYHLVPSIDRWVVHAAFAALAQAALDAGETSGPRCFAINLSGQSLGDDDFLDYVLAELAASRVDPATLCFEITETAAVATLARAKRFISVLKGLGCRFVLDDFGTGLSSFAYLKNLAVDFLKIDGAFVRDVTGSTIQRALVESINQIGHVMGIQTIAEGVEDPATLAALKEIGVDYVQGYGVAPPEPLA